MATKKSTVDYIVEQASGEAPAAGPVSAQAMFGEYGLYKAGKLVALVCDDQLFVKPSQAGRDFIGSVVEAAPYPGAKPCLLISGDRWDDRSWMSALFDISAVALPAPKVKTKKLKAKPVSR